MFLSFDVCPIWQEEVPSVATLLQYGMGVEQPCEISLEPP